MRFDDRCDDFCCNEACRNGACCDGNESRTTNCSFDQRSRQYRKSPRLLNSCSTLPSSEIYRNSLKCRRFCCCDGSEAFCTSESEAIDDCCSKSRNFEESTCCCSLRVRDSLQHRSKICKGNSEKLTATQLSDFSDERSICHNQSLSKSSKFFQNRPLMTFAPKEALVNRSRAGWLNDWRGSVSATTRGVCIDGARNRRIRCDPVKRWHQYKDYWNGDK